MNPATTLVVSFVAVDFCNTNRARDVFIAADNDKW